MIFPTGVIVPLYLAVFLLASFQYYWVNPKRRVSDPRFILMAGGFIGTFSYPLVRSLWHGGSHLAIASSIYFAVGVLWLGAALYLLRRMPPRQRS